MFLKRQSPAIAWGVIILLLTLAPGKTLPNVPIFGIDKIVHFIIFGLLLFLSLYSNKNRYNRKIALSSLIICIGYGIIIEFIQEYIPGRSFSIYDILANSIGVGLGYLFFQWVVNKKTV
jgi:VanZ family protein